MIGIISTWTTLEAMRETVLKEDLSGVMTIAGILSCITCGIAVLKVVKVYINVASMDPWEFFKPIIIMILVCNFETFILTPVNSLTSIVSRESAEVFDMRPNKYVSKWADNMVVIGQYVADENNDSYEKELQDLVEKDISAFGMFFKKMWLGIKKYLMHFFNVGSLTVGGIVGGVLFLIVKILLFAQQILCNLYLLINSLLGPYILAMSILPGFENGFKNWLARYFQVSMWIPVGYMVMGINLGISNCFVDRAASGEAGLGLEWMMIVLQIVALVSVTAVPKFVTWIIHVPGSSDAHGSISSMTKRALKIG